MSELPDPINHRDGNTIKDVRVEKFEGRHKNCIKLYLTIQTVDGTTFERECSILSQWRGLEFGAQIGDQIVWFPTTEDEKKGYRHLTANYFKVDELTKKEKELETVKEAFSILTKKED